MKQAKTAIVILAAGLGTRMKSSTPKVLHKLFDRPMLQYSLDTAARLKPSATVVVVGKDHKLIEQSVGFEGGTIEFAIQDKQLGTAHALISAIKHLKGHRFETLVVTNGDCPLLTEATLKKFLSLHHRGANSVSVLSFKAKDPSAYGRIVRDAKGKAAAIVEEKDCTPEQAAISEVNSGVYAIDASAISLVERIEVNRKKGEYYLTDVLALALASGQRASVHCVGTEEEFLGINNRRDLSAALRAMRLKKAAELAEEGVTVMDPETAHIAPQVKVGADSVIYPNVYIHGKSIIGKGCTIYPGTRIVDSTLKDNVTIKDGCLIEDSTIQEEAQVGPFAHLRPGSILGKSVKVGNFVEVKKSTIASGTKAMHLSYIGDAEIGADVNIGAGTITCNYDGVNKHKTVIGKGVFIGSDTQLVAPVTIGAGAYVGAGSTITKDVSAEALAVSRTKQTNIEGWAKHKKQGKKK